MEISELLAKVLATENINVSKQNVRTASFDLVGRNLTLPMWQGLEPVVETMLVCHEVGHALFTPRAYVETVMANVAISDILNVVEDARIERLFKERYPGSRKDFVAAYKELRETDFFELAGRNVNDMDFVDRINVYFKLGVFSGVKFSREEHQYVKRATETVTFEEVKELAEDIFEYLKKKREEQQQEQEQEQEQYQEEVAMSSDEEGDDDEDWQEMSDAIFGQGLEETKRRIYSDVGRSETVKTMEQKLGDKTNFGNPPVYLQFDMKYNENIVVGYKKIIEKCRAKFNQPHDNFTHFSNLFKKENAKQVSHLVSQFEMRKAAQVYALRTVHKTGRLNTNIIAQYKVKDDLFLRNAKVPEGKNHGMVMLLDWSGSMLSGRKIYYSLSQAVQLAMFCRMVGIPYRILAFSSRDDVKPLETTANNGEGSLTLLELMSNEMTTKEHNEMIGLLMSNTVLNLYGLGSTPLSPALLYMRKYLPEFKKQYRIDKLNLITFTDGENTTRMVSNTSYSRNSIYIKDEETKKNYLVTDESDSLRNLNTKEINAMYRMLKDRLDCTITSYFISNDLYEGVRSSGFFREIARVADRKKFSTEGFVSMTGYGRDSALVVNPRILQGGVFSTTGISADMSAAKIASELRKGAKNSIRGKILIDKFMAVIS